MMGLVLAGAAAFALTACSGNNASQSTEAAATTVPGTQTEAAAETESGSYTVTDVRGKEIEFDVVPERVATVGKPFPSIYYAIEGATDNIVGCNPSSITAYNESVLKDMYPQLENAETDWCTKDSTVNVEELLKLRPDVVFIYSTNDKEIEKMENAGLKVVALRSAELDSVKENLQIMAAVCQKEERGEQLVQYIDEGIEEVTSRLADVSEEDKPTVVELYSDMNVSVKQYDHWMIPSGAKNPAEDLTGKMAEVDMEQMLLWNDLQDLISARSRGASGVSARATAGSAAAGTGTCARAGTSASGRIAGAGIVEPEFASEPGVVAPSFFESSASISAASFFGFRISVILSRML